MDPNANSPNLPDRDPRFESWPDRQAREARERGALTADPREVDRLAVAEGATRDGLSALEIAHVRHILQKHFFHDTPDPDAIKAGSAGYCPHCEAAVTTTYGDGTAVCGNGHRFPLQSVRR